MLEEFCPKPDAASTTMTAALNIRAATMCVIFILPNLTQDYPVVVWHELAMVCHRFYPDGLRNHLVNFRSTDNRIRRADRKRTRAGIRVALKFSNIFSHS